MITNPSETAALDWLAQPPAPRVDEPGWLQAVRRGALGRVGEMGLPTRREEDWRYTSLDFLTDRRFAVDGESFDALQLSDIEELLLDQAGHTRLVFVNGRLAPNLCAGLGPAEGVEIRTLGGDMGTPSEVLHGKLDRIAETHHIFAALNGALMSDGAMIHVRGDTGHVPLIELLHVSVGMEEPQVCHPRHLVVLGQGARAELIERYCALGEGQYFNNALVEVSLAAHSRLRHMRSQEESDQAQHLSDLHVRLAGSADYALSQASLGGAWSRTDVRVILAGEHARAELDGLMLARDRQLSDVHLDIRHEVPNCASRETFKGILDGRGRIVFDGHIVVARDAQGSDAILSNDNLMLSRSAEVDTKPQLEIYADDVKCSHGTTVGELDADMLFYLRSRGLSEGQAVQMLCQGFAGEIMDRVGHDGLRGRLERVLNRRLHSLDANP